jgi:hypothetical protein
MIRQPKDDRVVDESHLFERTEHCRDVLVDHGMKIGVKVDVVFRRLRAIERRKLVVGVSRQFLEA